MADQKVAAPAKKNEVLASLTDKELEFLEHAWLVMKARPDIEYSKLAIVLGCSTKTVQNRWPGIMKKLGLAGKQEAGKQEAGTTGNVSVTTPTSDSAKKRKAANGESVPAKKATKTKTPKSTPQAQPVAKDKDEEDDKGSEQEESDAD